MCGRYRRTTKEEELARIYHIPIPPQSDLPIKAPDDIRFSEELRGTKEELLQVARRFQLEGLIAKNLEKTQ
jgi:ATP-dependent DNA ligase